MSDSRDRSTALTEFIGLCGARGWDARMASLRGIGATREGKGAMQRHAIELIIDRLSRARSDRVLTAAEQRIADYATNAVTLHQQLTSAGRIRFQALLAAALTGENCLVPAFHLLRTAALQHSRAFEIGYAGLEDGAPFDLLIRRGSAEAEIACDVVSAEEGRGVHRGAWCRLVDRIDPELQTWLRAHPGRYLMKLTFPLGLKLPGCDESGMLAALQRRVSQMLAEQRRADSDEALVLRLDPLMLAAAQADELGLMPRLREEFGPEAHLSVSAGSGGLFVLAARAGQQNDIAAAVRRRMAAIVPGRLTGTRPGILAMFIEDTDRLEWRLLREKLELEGEARQFLTNPAARGVVAITCSSRLELFGIGAPDAAPDGELRFRNQAHPAAKQIDLAPAVLSSM
ncbi:MAG: hypothetical protein RQ966_12215 [Acetobacteraceae bacterium]|nr:hypothetical protein [Acetobacteraceae bacterium]